MVSEQGACVAGNDRMGEPTAPAGHTDPPRGRLSTKRAAVLRALSAGGAMSADQVASAVGLHTNTVRFHLRRLVEDGVVCEQRGVGGGRGRPGVRYRARPGAEGGRSYALLSQMLVDLAADVDAEQLDEVGRAWGGRLLAETAPADDVVATVQAVMSSVGFAPRIETDRRGLTVHLTHCPFVEAARRRPDLVCTLHRSVLQGVLDGVDEELRVAELVPFATSTTCLARVRRAV
jgi:predicted ArsR family transcriptional regulator